MARKDESAPASEVNSLAAPGALESGEKTENFAGDKESEAYKTAEKLYDRLKKQYDNQQERADDIAEFWNIYNAIPDTNQQYSGNSQCYVPAVRDCVNARAKRTLKQLFPSKTRHVEAVGASDETPYAQLALLEHDIRATRLKEVVRSDLVAGDVTGQWNLYIDWTKSYRRITELIKRNPALETADGEETPLVDPGEEEDATEESDVVEEGPEIVDFADEDLAVIPPTCNDIEKSEASCIRLRMSKAKVEMLVDEGVFELEENETVEELWKTLEGASKDTSMSKQTPPKNRANDAGVKTDGTFKYLLCYEAHTELEFDEDEGKVKRLAYVYYGSGTRILGIVKAPQWGGKRPIVSAPADRITGSFKGRSKIEPVKFLQWNLNDYWNMGQDSAMYSLLPIWAIDPLANPTWSSMVMGLAAIWPVDPNKVKPLTSPQLYKDSIQLCEAIKLQIRESMDVNELMLGRMPQGRKNNQLMQQMQQDQMTNIMDNAERYEEVILTPIAERLFEYERQFRTTDLLVVTRGEIGVKAKMTEVNPQQFDERFRFQWCGTAIVQGQQMMQQQIAFMNVLRGVPPQQLNGRKLDVTPILELQVEKLFGPELAPRILIDERNLYTVDPNIENEMMHNNLPVQIHEADDDAQHLQVHMSGARLTGDTQGKYRAHIAAHTMAMQAKMQKQMGQQQGQPGAPGAGPPGMAGSPRVGGQPSGPKTVQGPPGLPGADQTGPPRG
jgi:hypothetical protein